MRPNESSAAGAAGTASAGGTGRALPAAAARINALVARFVAGQPLRDFRRDFLRFSESFDEQVLPAAQRDAYWAVHDLLCMAPPRRAAAPGGGARGETALGESALRERLRRFRLVEPGDAST